MDPIMQQLLRSIEVIHSGVSDPNERKTAQEFVENFKNSSTSVGAYAIQLINKEHNDVIRHFGFHLIEHMINHQWGLSLQAPQKMEIKNVLLNYAATGTKSILEEKQFIKTKLCALIVEVMKREWPQRMPDVLEKIIQLASMGPTQCELAVIVLRTLAQDVSSEFSSDMDSDRKKEVIHGLKEHTDPLFSFLLNMFERCYKSFKESPPNSEGQRINEKILHELLQASVSLINDWISLTVFFKHNFINIWCYLLTEENLKSIAAECLLLFTIRKWSDTEIEISHIVDFLNTFCTKCMEIVRATNNDNILDEYEFHKTLAKIVGGFGSTNMYLLKENNAKFAEMFYDVVLEFVKYPSQVICNEVINVWVNALEPPKKEEMTVVFTKLPFFEKYYSPIIEACSNKMLREVGNPDNEVFAESMMNQTSSLEFQDKNEYAHFFGTFRSKLTVLVKLIAERKCEFALQFVARGMESVLQRNGPAPNDVLTPNGFCDMSSQTYVLWESASTMLEWTIQGIPFKKLKPNHNCFKILTILLEMTLKFQTKDPLIQTRYLHTLQVLYPLYIYNHSALDATLQTLFVQMQFRLDREATASVNNLSEDSQAARRKAFSVFINLCNGHSGYLLPSLNGLVDNSEKLWREQKITSPELIMLYEAFVVISNQWKDYDKQFNFLKYLLNNLKDEWRSKPFSEVVGSEELLLKCLGVIEEPDEQRRNALREMRDKIIHALNMFKSIAKRMPYNAQDMGLTQRIKTNSGGSKLIVRYPIAPFLIEILPNVMAMIRTLHSVYRPAIQNMIPIEKRNPLFHIGVDEKQTMLKQVFIASRLSEYEHYLYSTHRNIRKMRAYCYELLGQACRYCDASQFWGNPQLFNLLSNSVFAFLDDIDNKDLKVLLTTFMVPFVTNCPKESYNSLLGPVLTPLYTLIYNRLDAGWNQIIQITKGNFVGNTNASDEVIHENILRELTAEVLEIPLLITKPLQKGKDNPNPGPDTLLKFIFGNEPVIAMLLMIAVRTMTIPDTAALNKSIQFSLRVTPYLVDNKRLQMIVAGELLQTSITSLMIFKQEMHQTIMGLIADIYYHYSNKCQYPEQVFMQIPGIKPNQVKNLNQALAKKKDEKKFKTSMRDFLKVVAGKSSGEFTKRKTILKIGGKQPPKGKDTSNLSFLDTMTLESVANLFQ